MNTNSRALHKSCASDLDNQDEYRRKHQEGIYLIVKDNVVEETNPLILRVIIDKVGSKLC